MPDLVRFGVSIDQDLLVSFDQLNRRRGYANRSEAIRDLIRDELVQESWETPEADVVATVTLVFDHHQREIADKLTGLQHDEFDVIVSSTHVHLDADNCLEVLILRGAARRVRLIADRLIATRGVRHGKSVMTTSGAIF